MSTSNDLPHEIPVVALNQFLPHAFSEKKCVATLQMPPKTDISRTQTRCQGQGDPKNSV